MERYNDQPTAGERIQLLATPRRKLFSETSSDHPFRIKYLTAEIRQQAPEIVLGCEAIVISAAPLSTVSFHCLPPADQEVTERSRPILRRAVLFRNRNESFDNRLKPLKRSHRANVYCIRYFFFKYYAIVLQMLAIAN